MKKILIYSIFLISLIFSHKPFGVPILNSYSSSSYVILLDFDGHYVQSSWWNNGNPLNCVHSGLTELQMIEAFHRVAEDFRPFDINVTTDETVFNNTLINKRVRIIITATSSWSPGVGGTAYVGSFVWGDDTPAFVFSDRHGYSPKKVGETISHEAGHTFGLSHQSKYSQTNCTTPIEVYNSGYGSGEIGWAPIMGDSRYRNFTTWNNGPTPDGCTNIEDNLSIITTQNGFGYRIDDYPEIMNASTTGLQGSGFNINGVITTNTDKDAFRFILNSTSNFYLSAIPFNVLGNVIGANLDIRIELYNSSQVLIRDFNPVTTLSNIVDTVLTTGTYYLKIYGTGNSNVGSYGSLGSYTIAGSFSGLPIHDIRLSGTVDKGKHTLSWKIIADEPIKTIEVQTSTDGTNFNPLTTVTSSSNNFTYQSYHSNVVFYRLKVTSVINETGYSNTITLRGTSNIDKLFSVSTLVQNDIIINAADNYQYVLYDMNGRIIKTGKGLKGINRVNIGDQPKGMFIIQLFSNGYRQIERIINVP